jgi:hypothetical protein
MEKSQTDEFLTRAEARRIAATIAKLRSCCERTSAAAPCCWCSFGRAGRCFQRSSCPLATLGIFYKPASLVRHRTVLTVDRASAGSLERVNLAGQALVPLDVSASVFLLLFDSFGDGMEVHLTE